jgi:hypothetical protein
MHGGIGRSSIACGPQPSFANVVRPADLIVEATIQRSVSYLTADDDDVYTDYETTIHWVFFQRHALATSRPGVAIPILLKSHGGQVMIGDVRISVDESWGNARVSVREGDRVYLFAKRDASDGKWLFGPYGVFKINGDEVRPPTRFTDLTESVPRQTFLEKIHELQPAAAIR